MADGGGSQTDTAGQQLSVDQNKLAEFMRTAQGAKWAAGYVPGASYYQRHTDQGEIVSAYPPGFKGSYAGGLNVSDMMADYTQWLNGMAATEANWKNYADTAAKFEGGQGDSTITEGAAQSQRQALLGGLANAGNPTTPTPGLGSFGMAAGPTTKRIGVPR